MSESDIDNAISTISGYVSACMAGIDEGASDYDKAVHFYEYVIEHAEYEEILLTTRICTQQCLVGRSVRAMR